MSNHHKCIVGLPTAAGCQGYFSGELTHIYTPALMTLALEISWLNKQEINALKNQTAMICVGWLYVAVFKI